MLHTHRCGLAWEISVASQTWSSSRRYPNTGGLRIVDQGTFCRPTAQFQLGRSGVSRKPYEKNMDCRYCHLECLQMTIDGRNDTITWYFPVSGHTFPPLPTTYSSWHHNKEEKLHELQPLCATNMQIICMDCWCKIGLYIADGLLQQRWAKFDGLSSGKHGLVIWSMVRHPLILQILNQ